MSSQPAALKPLTGKPVTRRAVLWAAIAAFFLIGAVQALYGPAFPLLRERFGIGLEQVSIVVSAQFLGAFAGIVLSGFFLRALGYRRVLLAACVALALGVGVVAVAPVWLAVLGGAVLAGIGAGLLNVTGNLLIAVAFRPTAAPALNIINAAFGVGAVVGPLLVTVTEPHYGWAFAAAALVAILLLPWFTRLSVPGAAPPERGAAPVAWGSLAAFVLLYGFYVSAAGGVTAWATAYLTPSFGTRAAAFTSLYWLAITAGRLLAAPLSARIRTHHFVLGATVATLVFMVAAHRVESAPIAFVLVGLSLAPIFPTALAWLTEVFPQRAEQVTPVVVAAANLGPALSSPVIGAVVHAGGVQVVPTALSAMTLALLLTVVWLWVATKGRA